MTVVEQFTFELIRDFNTFFTGQIDSGGDLAKTRRTFFDADRLQIFIIARANNHARAHRAIGQTVDDDKRACTFVSFVIIEHDGRIHRNRTQPDFIEMKRIRVVMFQRVHVDTMMNQRHRTRNGARR